MTVSGATDDRRPPTSSRFDRIARPATPEGRVPPASVTRPVGGADPRELASEPGPDPLAGPSARARPAVSARPGVTWRDRDGLGKEALYSTAPTSAPTSQVELRCRRCDVPFGSSLVGVAKLVVRPFLWDPVRGRLWTRCPACDRRAWLEIRAGQALRILMKRRAGA